MAQPTADPESDAPARGDYAIRGAAPDERSLRRLTKQASLTTRRFLSPDEERREWGTAVAETPTANARMSTWTLGEPRTPRAWVVRTSRCDPDGAR
jgi:hypothetical protein